MVSLRWWCPHPLSIFCHETLTPSVEQCWETGNCVEVMISMLLLNMLYLSCLMYFFYILRKSCAEWSLLNFVVLVIFPGPRSLALLGRAQSKRIPTLWLGQMIVIEMKRMSSFERHSDTFALSLYLVCTSFLPSKAGFGAGAFRPPCFRVSWFQFPWQ